MSSTGATYNAGARLEAAKAADRTLDLLAIPLVRKILLSRYLLPALQVCCLVLFGLVIYDGFLGVQAQEKNFATLGVWFLFFWPVILLSLVFLGRAWCAVCPIGTLTAIAGRWSLGRSFPKSLSNLSLSLLFFIFVLWILRPILGISSSPAFTAWFVIAWALVAIVLGLLFARRAFCQFVCPILAPLSVIARVAPVELRAASGGRMNPICRRCRSRACYNGSATVGGCPMGEFPAAMESNANCIFCLDCLKSCPERSPLQIRLRWPFAELTRVKRPLLLDSLTVIVLSGIFLFHMAIGHEPRMPHIFHIWSQGVHAVVPEMEHGDVEYLVTFVSALAAMGSLFATGAFVASRLAGVSFGKSFAISGYPFVALVVFRAMGYMAGDVITKGGHFVNYVASLLGIHTHHPAALVGSALQPIIPNTGYHLSGVLLTVPLVLGLPVACFLTYQTWKHLRLSPARALVVSLPSNMAMVVVVVIYEWAYLAGYRVV